MQADLARKPVGVCQDQRVTEGRLQLITQVLQAPSQRLACCVMHWLRLELQVWRHSESTSNGARDRRADEGDDGGCGGRGNGGDCGVAGGPSRPASCRGADWTPRRRVVAEADGGGRLPLPFAGLASLVATDRLTPSNRVKATTTTRLRRVILAPGLAACPERSAAPDRDGGSRRDRVRCEPPASSQNVRPSRHPARTRSARSR